MQTPHPETKNANNIRAFLSGGACVELEYL